MELFLIVLLLLTTIGLSILLIILCRLYSSTHSNFPWRYVSGYSLRNSDPFPTLMLQLI